MRKIKKLWVWKPFAVAVFLLCVPGCGKAGNPAGDAAGQSKMVSLSPANENAQGNVSSSEGAMGQDMAAAAGSPSAKPSASVSGSVSPEPGTPASGQGITSSGGSQTGQNTASPGVTPSGQNTPSSTGGVSSAEGIFVSSCGALAVDGTKLVDSAGNPIQLKGVSTHGLAWYPEYVNKECFRQLKEEWGVNVIRLAMYTAEYGGYCTGGNQDELKELVKSGVGYATECDMYVIIDWHILSDGNPNTYIEDAKAFFDEMSREYADSSNVLYEICNEPNGGTSWNDVKRYAGQVIEVIRANDEDGIILVGTPNWCQYVEQAATDPIEGYDNLMYTLHFYAATHTDDLRDAMERAIAAGLPVFVSEYGICDASGNGAINEYQAGEWVNTLNGYQISYVAWNLSNKGESSAILKSSCKKESGFTEEDLSDSGKWLYNMLGNTDGPRQAGNSGTDGAGNGSGHEAGNGTELEDGQEDTGTGNGTEQGAGQEDTGTGNGTEQEAGNGTTGTSDSGLGISAEMVNSWEQNNETCYQYTLTITNNTETDMDKWTVSLVFSGDIALNDGWNGIYQIDGNTLVISSMDYNGRIERNGSIGNIGFILRGAENLTICWE